jgi:hypothetical protein
MPPQTPPTSHRRIYYSHAAALFATLPFAIGTLATLSPPTALQILSFPPPSSASTTQDRATILGLGRIFGVRDMVLGFSSLCIWYLGGARKGNVESCAALGAITLAGVGLVVVDGVASGEVIGGGQWNHWAFAPFGAVIGGGLMGWW